MRRTASRASARSGWCRPPARWPPRSTTSTASGAPACPCDARATPASAGARVSVSVSAVETPGLVCAHHHLYSSLARGMPAPARTPTTFVEILERIWWRLDRALDLELVRWSARLGALEALEAGTTAIVDHHSSPNAIEGSLDVIAEACAEVGVRVRCCYEVTDRNGLDGAKAGLAENERFLRGRGDGLRRRARVLHALRRDPRRGVRPRRRPRGRRPPPRRRIGGRRRRAGAA